MRIELLGLAILSDFWPVGSISLGLFFMKVMTWNCQGAASKEFMSVLKNFVKHNKPEIIVLLEPRISGFR